MKKQTNLVAVIMAVGDLLFTGIAFYAAYWLRFNSGILPHSNPDVHQYLIILGCILPLWAGLFSFFGLYDLQRYQRRRDEFQQLAMAIACGVVFISAFTFFYREFSYSRLTFLLFGVINFAIVAAERQVMRAILQYAHKRGYDLRQVLIIGSGPLGLRIAKRILMHPETGYRLVGFLDDIQSNGVYKEEFGLEILGNISSLNSIIDKFQIDKVFVALPFRAMNKISRIVALCEKEGVETDLVPDYRDVIQTRAKAYDFAGLPLISVRACPVDSWMYRIGKRYFDIVFAFFALVLLSPLMLIIGCAVKLSSRGPVLFKQERIGARRRPFKMLKFRTMHVDAEKYDREVGLGERNDPRVTKLGNFLRTWSLDEIPQFWNVLRGDMSIVGPRPERTFHVKQFKSTVPRYMIRHQVKTGMTGWAQVNGWRGDTSIDKRIEHDLFYIENWSLWFDLKIILLTVGKGLVNENA